jgi:ElaB/YqjD/DUF883 family membrane-anchored ribosome-binding protein
MVKKNKASSDDMAAVEELMQDLEARLRRLNTNATDSDGPEDISDFVAQTLARIAAQVRETAGAATDSLADEATRASSDILKRIWEEMERRPLTTLAIAAAAGYLLGLIGKQDKAE